LYYCRSLKFEEKPDYAYCKKLFRELFYKNDFSSTAFFDWVPYQSSKKLGRHLSSKMSIKNDSTIGLKKSNEDHSSSNAKATEQGNAKSSLNISKKDLPKEEMLAKDANDQSNIVANEFDDLVIPNEHAIPTRIVVPMTTFIHNNKHWMKYKSKLRKTVKTANCYMHNKNSQTSLTEMSDISVLQALKYNKSPAYREANTIFTKNGQGSLKKEMFS
jgi:hypothetical protein